MAKSAWNTHYTKHRSQLLYPDENLVRMLLSVYPEKSTRHTLRTADIGCGSGRHAALLHDLEFGTVVATDISGNACRITTDIGIPAVECANRRLPFKDSSLDCAICWGSLHYCSPEETQQYIIELYRVLKPGAVMFGTLRSNDDTFFERIEKRDKNTYLVRTTDLQPSVVTFFSEDDMPRLFSLYSSIEHGMIERTRLGERARISHLFFKAVK